MAAQSARMNFSGPDLAPEQQPEPGDLGKREGRSQPDAEAGWRQLAHRPLIQPGWVRAAARRRPDPRTARHHPASMGQSRPPAARARTAAARRARKSPVEQSTDR
jgi:hypothetical protein